MLNIGVLVSGGGTNLQALIDAQARGEIENGKISLVISSKPDVYALTRAKENQIKSAVIPRKEYANAEEYTLAVIDCLKEHNIELVVLAGFLTILDNCIFESYENKMINVHPALIPAFSGKSYYGMHVHEAALARGVKLSGATVHFVNAVCDGGPIILQKAVSVEEDDTPETLQRRIMEQAEWTLLPKAVSLFCQGRLTVEGQAVRIRTE